MKIKSAFKQLKKNAFMNTLIVIQLAAVITIVCVLVSMIESRLEYYKPFSEEFSSEGYLCEFFPPVREQDVVSRLDNAKCEFTYSGQYLVNGMEAGNDENPQSVIYSDKWIEANTPKMQSGVWLDELPEDEYIHVAVTDLNPLGLKTGDVITVSDLYGNSGKARVIGVVENKQYTVGYSVFSQTDLPNRRNFFDMYYTYNSEVEGGKWGMFFAKSEIDGGALDSGAVAVCGMGFVFCDGMSDSGKKEVREMLVAEFSPMYTIPLEEIRSNSFGYIKEQLFVLLPIALCIFMLTLITTVSVVSISLNSQLKTYAVFYICGAKWRDCSVISFLYSLMICGLSGLISIGAILILTAKTDTVIKTGVWEIGAMLAVEAVYLV
ncbi:MAG: hypothetical protein ACI4RG_11355, partial [Huintestinicola sp.]